MDFTTDLDGKTCVKCDLDAKFTGVDPKKAWYCTDCFLQMIRNKFRSAISKKKIYKDAEARDTLVVYDGTPSAAFLLHQVDDALKQINFKRLMIKPTILVLVSVTGANEIQLVLERVQQIKKVLVDKVRWVVAHVASCMYSGDLDVADSDLMCIGTEKIPDYLSVLESCTVQTYRKELERILKERCLLNIGEVIGITKVMVPDDADDLGRLALSQLCLGRGGAVSTLVSVVDKRSKFVFIRPLRDVSKKEISIYNHLSGVDEHCIQIREGTAVKSVQSLTDSFIHTLEAEKFYSTINTVLSTAAKIHSNSDEKSTSTCSLCQVESAKLCDTCSAIRDQCSSDLITGFIC